MTATEPSLYGAGGGEQGAQSAVNRKPDAGPREERSVKSERAGGGEQEDEGRGTEDGRECV